MKKTKPLVMIPIYICSFSRMNVEYGARDSLNPTGLNYCSLAHKMYVCYLVFEYIYNLAVHAKEEE